jgi:hypothetical protein
MDTVQFSESGQTTEPFQLGAVQCVPDSNGLLFLEQTNYPHILHVVQHFQQQSFTSIVNVFFWWTCVGSALEAARPDFPHIVLFVATGHEFITVIMFIFYYFHCFVTAL